MSPKRTTPLFLYGVIIGIVLFLFSAVGCTGQNETIAANATQAMTLTATTVPIFATPTASTMPTLTFTVTPLSTTTPSPTVVMSTTPLVPTLSVEETGVFLSELMANNGGCELPCWWGVNPGETTEQKAQDIFVSWGIREWVVSDFYRIVVLGYARPEFPHYIPDVSAKLWINGGLVQYIYVSGQKPKLELENQFIEDWQRYSLKKILNRFGVPTYVRLESTTPDGSSTTYVMGLSYPSVGIEIDYVIEVDVSKDQQLLICPDFAHIRFITLDLYLSDWGTQVPEYIIPNHLEEYTSWESVTGSDLENFYELYHQDGEIPCVTLTP